MDGLARSAGNHVRTDQMGTALTGAQLTDRIKVRDVNSSNECRQVSKRTPLEGLHATFIGKEPL